MIAYQTPEERPIAKHLLSNYHTTTLKTWIGGYRYRPQEWTEPKNWYPQGVPSWNDKVILGGYTKHTCNITSGVDDISALCILKGATLIISKRGRLTIDGLLADPLGMLGDSGLSNSGTIRNSGQLMLRNAAYEGIRNEGIMENEGKIFADESISTSSIHWGDFSDRGERVFLVRD